MSGPNTSIVVSSTPAVAAPGQENNSTLPRAGSELHMTSLGNTSQVTTQASLCGPSSAVNDSIPYASMASSGNATQEASTTVQGSANLIPPPAPGPGRKSVEDDLKAAVNVLNEFSSLIETRWNEILAYIGVLILTTQFLRACTPDFWVATPVHTDFI
ncbi:hypothetical protein K474DRAFT_1776720 [Panus rudis PR-1116 ss-1]|nr:hypothetical protein K474DRAFT_1776720 [Panus rudis PR-1116 ss-1]